MKKHFLTRVLSLCLMFTVLCFSAAVTSSALDTPQQNGKLTIKARNGLMGVELSLYEVGTYSYDRDELTLNDNFKDCPIPSNKLAVSADERKNLFDALGDYVKEHSSITHLHNRIGRDGSVVFDNLKTDYTAYLIVQTSHLTNHMRPFVVVIPYTYDGGVLQTDVTIEEKFVGAADEIFEGAVILNKTNNENQPLADAEFKVECKVYYDNEPNDLSAFEKGEDADGTFYWYPVLQDLITDENGQIVLTSMVLRQTYRFVEVSAPDGYILDPTPHIFYLDAFGTVKIENDIYVPDEGEVFTLNVVNNPKENPPTDSSEPSTPSSEPPIESSVYSEPTSSSPSVSTPSTPSKVSTPILPTPDTVTSYTPPAQTSQSVWFEITGDELSKYIIIGAVVLGSLAVVILLVVLSGRKKK